MLLVLLVGCSERLAAPESVRESTAAAAPAAANSGGLPAERMVIHETSERLRSDKPRAVTDAAAKIAATAGGFVLDSELRTIDGRVGEIELQLRVPQQTLDGTLSQLRRLGSVLEEQVKGQDVTEEFVDVSSRLRAQRTLEARLLALLQGSAALKDLLAVEQELARVRAEIEQQEGRIRYLQERSRMAAIRLVAQSASQPLVASSQSLGSRISNAFERSLEAAVSVTELLITALGALLPPMLLALAIGAPLLRLRKRRLAMRQSAASA
jgi:hypothetical protein